MTISPCSQRPANRCALKLRWNAAPALNISGRESSSLWLPLNTAIFLPKPERSWWADVLYTPKVSIAMGSNKYRPSMLEYLTSLRAAAPATYESANLLIVNPLFFLQHWIWKWKVASITHLLCGNSRSLISRAESFCA